MSSTIDEAVILAGGLGTRLNPLTKFLPKPLVPVVNYTMLDWNFLLLAQNGIRKAIVVVNYLENQIREHIEKFSSKILPDLDIIIPDVDSKGTADALRSVSDFVKSNNFFVTMADIITNINLKQMACYHRKKGGIATISLKPVYNCPKQFGVTLIDEKRRITKFLEKPNFDELCILKMVFERSGNIDYQKNLINSGIYAFRKDILDILDEEKELNDFGNMVFPFLLKTRQEIYGFISESYWQDCGRPEQIIWTSKDILSQKMPNLFLNFKENISGELIKKFPDYFKAKSFVIGNNVKIKSGTKLLFSSIGNQSYIGKNCSIKGSSIWENVKIGNNVIIENAIISNDVKIGNNCVITEGSVITPGSIIAPNSIINN